MATGKISVKEFLLVAVSIVSVLTVSFTTLSSDHVYEISMGLNKHYELPQRFVFALIGFVAGALLVTFLTFILVVEGRM